MQEIIKCTLPLNHVKSLLYLPLNLVSALVYISISKCMTLSVTQGNDLSHLFGTGDTTSGALSSFCFPHTRQAATLLEEVQ